MSGGSLLRREAADGAGVAWGREWSSAPGSWHPGITAVSKGLARHGANGRDSDGCAAVN